MIMKNRISVSEVAELMNVSEQFIRIGLQKGIFPFGYTDDVGEALEKLETPSVKAHKAINQIKNSGIELGTAFIGALAPTLII